MAAAAMAHSGSERVRTDLVILCGRHPDTHGYINMRTSLYQNGAKKRGLPAECISRSLPISTLYDQVLPSSALSSASAVLSRFFSIFQGKRYLLPGDVLTIKHCNDPSVSPPPPQFPAVLQISAIYRLIQ